MKLLRQWAIFICISVLLIIVVVTTNYILHNKQRLLSSINTQSFYNNDLYGISFQYPKQLNVVEGERSNGYEILITPYTRGDNKLRSDLGMVDSITIVIHHNNESIKELINSAKMGMSKDAKQVDEILGGVDAVHLSYVSSFAGEEENIIFMLCKEGVPYIAELSYAGPLSEDYLSVIKSINVCKKRPL